MKGHINNTLKELLLKEDEEGLNYKANIGGETFDIKVETDKTGINMIFTPVSPNGEMIYNLSEEELNTLKNSLMTTLGPKFAQYKIELTSEDIKENETFVKINIPVGSVYPFLKNIISK